MSHTVIPAAMKIEVLARDGWRCLCCGRQCHRYPDSRVRPDTLSFDHKLPEFLGGTTTVDNLQVLCMACNIHKGVQTMDYSHYEKSDGCPGPLLESGCPRCGRVPIATLRGVGADPGFLFRPQLKHPAIAPARYQPLWPTPGFQVRTDDGRPHYLVPSDSEWQRLYRHFNQAVAPLWAEERSWFGKRDMRLFNWPALWRSDKAMPPCPVRDRLEREELTEPTDTVLARLQSRWES